MKGPTPSERLFKGSKRRDSGNLDSLVGAVLVLVPSQQAEEHTRTSLTQPPPSQSSSFNTRSLSQIAFQFFGKAKPTPENNSTKIADAPSPSKSLSLFQILWRKLFKKRSSTKPEPTDNSCVNIKTSNSTSSSKITEGHFSIDSSSAIHHTTPVASQTQPSEESLPVLAELKESTRSSEAGHSGKQQQLDVGSTSLISKKRQLSSKRVSFLDHSAESASTGDSNLTKLSSQPPLIPHPFPDYLSLSSKDTENKDYKSIQRQAREKTRADSIIRFDFNNLNSMSFSADEQGKGKATALDWEKTVSLVVEKSQGRVEAENNDHENIENPVEDQSRVKTAVLDFATIEGTTSLTEDKGKGKANIQDEAPVEDPSMPFSNATTAKHNGNTEEDANIEKVNAAFQSEKNQFMTVREASTMRYASYADGKMTMKSDEWGFVAEHCPLGGSTIPCNSKLLKAKQSVVDLATKAGLVAKPKEQVRKVVDEFPVVPPPPLITSHEPLQIFGEPPTKLELAMEKSPALTTVIDTFNTINIFNKRKPHRNWDRRGEEGDPLDNIQPELPEEMSEEEIIDLNRFNLVAVSNKQFEELQAKTPDHIILSMPTTKDPNSTPRVLEAAEKQKDADEENDTGKEHDTGKENDTDKKKTKGGEVGSSSKAEDGDTKANHDSDIEDLRKLRDPYVGFVIIPGSEGNFPEIYGKLNNLSDYYGMPLIEIGRDCKWEALDPVNELEMKFQHAAAYNEASGDYGYENRDEDATYEDPYSNDESKNFARHPREQLPGQALMIYYWFSGFPGSNMSSKVADLDPVFLYEHESRVWKGYRIPQHTQLTEAAAEKIKEIAERDPPWYEKHGVDQEWSTTPGAKVPKSMGVMLKRMRARAVERSMVQTLENYFFWRFLGELPHAEVKSGPSLKLGDY